MDVWFYIAVIFAIVGAFVYFLTGNSSSISSISVPDTYKECPDCSEIVRKMAYSLDTQPTAWSTNGYEIWREGGGAAWIANSDYGISIGPEKSKLAKIDNENDRRALWAAYQRWAINQKRF